MSRFDCVAGPAGPCGVSPAPLRRNLFVGPLRGRRLLLCPPGGRLPGAGGQDSATFCENDKPSQRFFPLVSRSLDRARGWIFLIASSGPWEARPLPCPHQTRRTLQPTLRNPRPILTFIVELQYLYSFMHRPRWARCSRSPGTPLPQPPGLRQQPRHPPAPPPAAASSSPAALAPIEPGGFTRLLGVLDVADRRLCGCSRVGSSDRRAPDQPYGGRQRRGTAADGGGSSRSTELACQRTSADNFRRRSSATGGGNSTLLFRRPELGGRRRQGTPPADLRPGRGRGRRDSVKA